MISMLWEIPSQLHRFSFVQFLFKMPIIVEQFCLGVLPSFPVQARDVVVNNIESASGEESEL